MASSVGDSLVCGMYKKDCSDPQCSSRSAASGTCGNLLEMQEHGPQPRPTELLSVF